MPVNITEWIVRIPVLLFAITIHEYGHGKAALSLGDPTAKDQGRLTLNPLSHLDPLGAICLFLFNFGWAKPVPVDPRYFQNPRRDIVLMSMSGPVANLAAAFVAGIFVRYFLLPFEVYQKVLVYLVLMNVGLGLFNLIPIPPLDGSHILENILPNSIASVYRRFRRYGAFFLIAVVLLDNFAHTGILNRILIYPMLALSRLFAGDHLFRLLHLL
ncbi:MAG: site-2 protease family protein [Deltaproteobacteria bacterium]|nr:MAG: site-2 protease family protein [Deltaproteobacteria bacterium]